MSVQIESRFHAAEEAGGAASVAHTAAVREQSRELTAAIIVAMEEQRRDLSDEIAFHRSQLRNDLAGENWSCAGYTVKFLEGFTTAVPTRRIGKAIAFKRVRRDPYMAVRRKKAST